ncbi:TAXI family TRAP transporter solute-binding subunit [Agromyces salentinus]|uniref:TAXI family TRAP transporter solute-binding subunit n=1 Tax=Agromyces salentinus TaxID=269421 RepID=A0ABN2N191_9MICO|nr:TAXI family TRAP transporter solute-binding subunit [Agromyces salentinus]
MSLANSQQTGPRLAAPVNLRFKADWGQANLTRISGWLAQEIGDRAPEGSQFSIHAGRGGVDAVAALQDGRADIALITPAPAGRLMFEGTGPAGNAPSPWLRALGKITHRDRLVVAVDADLPVHTVADLAGIADQLVIGTSADDGVNAIGLAAHLGLKLAGADPEQLRRDGAQFLYDERPFPLVHAFATGSINVLIQEAVMMPAWQRIAERRAVRYLEWGDAVIEGFAAIGWPSAIVAAGYLPTLEKDLLTLDFADFLLLCREDLDEDVAYLATWCMVKTRLALESQYQHIPPDHTPVGYPLDPAEMQDTPVPLHPGARRAYLDVAGQGPLTDGLLWT